ncbi:MAG: glycosyltransferase family 2 protein [Candidatus Omnitrophota bacterium]
MTISAIVLTRDEEKHIENCLESLAWADERLVIDSGSADRTVQLAEKCGARVVSHPFTDFASQRNFAVSEAKGDWVLFIDADERVTLHLIDELKRAAQGPESVYAVPRFNYFFGKRLRFADAQEDAPVRFFPRQQATWAQPVHERVVSDLPVRQFQSPILHYSTRDLAHYLKKVDDYVPLELHTLRVKGVKPALWRVFLVPPAKFLWLFIFKRGFLDGVAGFQYAILSAYYAFRKYWLYLRQGV